MNKPVLQPAWERPVGSPLEGYSLEMTAKDMESSQAQQQK